MILKMGSAEGYSENGYDFVCDSEDGFGFSLGDDDGNCKKLWAWSVGKCLKV
ncbi:hypothetical protein Pint_27195 [Pistacia integerrima]|uniref:Uncharacterized protein n=1 Tax=Pistacia integerrima TaxID=434235 RepID=A0ACC0YUS1_9ROSI|nr:hypothetical protein Pint_27195 [Pistacia integerrima]